MRLDKNMVKGTTEEQDVDVGDRIKSAIRSAGSKLGSILPSSEPEPNASVKPSNNFSNEANASEKKQSIPTPSFESLVNNAKSRKQVATLANVDQEKLNPKVVKNAAKIAEGSKNPEESSGLERSIAVALSSLIPTIASTAIGGVEAGAATAQLGNEQAKLLQARFDAQDEAKRKEKERLEDQQFKLKMQQNQLFNQRMMQELKQGQTLGEKQQKLFIPELNQFALSEDDAKKTKAELAETSNLLSQLNELIALRKSKGAEVMDRDAVARSQALAKSIQLTLKSDAFAKLGVLTGPDLAILESLVPSDPLESNISTWTGGLAPDTTLSQLDEVRSQLERGVTSKLKSRGFQGGEQYVSQFRGLSDSIQEKAQQANDIAGSQINSLLGGNQAVAAQPTMTDKVKASLGGMTREQKIQLLQALEAQSKAQGVQ